MKKSYSIGADAKISDKLEGTRRLYRNITEISKKLEEEKNGALAVIDIFTPTGEALRSKLRDYCERLILSDPLNHVQKTEEVLWRRGFYDIVSGAKKLRKGHSWNDMERAFLSAHLSVGFGFYHHLILRLQLEYNLELVGVIDFAYPQNQKEVKNGNSSTSQTIELKKHVLRFIHRSLICLGDLARYRLDLDPNWDPQIATRYYKMAIAMDSKYGMPHNQLGTVANNKNYGLNAVYHYMRSTLCEEPFDGAEGNLKKSINFHSLNGKEKCLTQSCIARLLLLLQLWDNNTTNIDLINRESQTLLNDIENSLNVEKIENIDHKSAQNEDSIEKYLLCYKSDETNYLTDDTMFKIIVICLMKISKMQLKEPHEVYGITAFVLAVFSQLLQFVVMRLQESLLDMSIESRTQEDQSGNSTKKDNFNRIHEDNNDNNLKNEESVSNTISINQGKEIEINGNNIKKRMKKSRDKSKSLLTKLRRPRNRKNSSDSDVSDGERLGLGSSSEDMNSDVSETGEDIMSDENILSDEALSEDEVLSDEEKLSKKKDSNYDKEEINGHADKVEEKFVEENENDIDIADTNQMNENDKSCNDITSINEPNGAFDENNASAITLTYLTQKEKQNLDPMKILKVLKDERMLISIKVCCDWLHGHQDIVRTCAKGSKSLLKRLTTLLNLINLDNSTLLKQCNKEFEIFSTSSKLEEIIETVPLSEDIDLRGLSIFENAHKAFDWEILRRKKITDIEETLLRALRIIKFGRYLCTIEESGMEYDNDKNLFILSNNEENNATKESQVVNKNFELDQSKGKLMRHMGKLWLKAEVHALESRLHHRLMSPYLVPDHEAFSKFMPVLKHLVYAKKFIVVVPSVVISALDELKKISSHAREATRWLESQLQRGSRFLRAQRPHEKLPIPYIKGPKPKDKEAWLYFQIVECCHYLTQQSKAGNNEIPVVTLLTGNDNKKTSNFSPELLVKSAGVNFEHIGTFHAKWKSSIKSHG